MPNAKFLQLKALLESKPEYKKMLTAIAKAEGTYGEDSYSTKYGGSKVNWRKGKDRKVTANDSAAHGRYQFNNATWDELTSELGLTGFSPEEQDVAALALLEKTGALKEIDSGNTKQAIFKAATRWAGLPKNENGDSNFKFEGTGKAQPAKSLKTVMGYIQSNRTTASDFNKILKEKNDNRYEDSTMPEYDSVIKSYTGLIDKINNNATLSENEKKSERHKIKNKFYKAGNLGLINELEKRRFDKKINILTDLKKLNEVEDYDGTLVLRSDGILLGPNSATVNGKKQKEKYQKIFDEAKKYNINLPDPKVFKNTKIIDANTINKIADNFSKLVVNRSEPDSDQQYGYTENEFNSRFPQNADADQVEPDYGGVASDIANTTTAETADEKKVREISEAKAKQVEAEKNKSFTGSDLLNNLTAPEEFVDPQFKYSPGKQQIPFDALIGLSTGILGAAAADDVEIKYREEQISEGMLQYAQDIAKIKRIGLDPAVEGALKMKLADAYQTGIENLVRASNGNRNLVLGNQGQLDKARMAGIVEIAAMDIDRTDKAMAAFGEVQKYINEFESRRDIANNDRRYQEDVFERNTGMQLAGQGMSNFIDAIQNARENAPGSMNDIRRQMFQFTATGILADAKPGEPGHADYKESMKVKHDLQNAKKKTYKDWINTKTLDEQDVLNNILTKNPQLNPLKNDQTEFAELEKMFNDVSGTDEYKSYYQKENKISDVVQNELEKESKAITGETKKIDAPVKEKQHIATLDAPIETIPVVKTKAPELVGPAIVGSVKLNPEVLLQNVANGVNGLPQGVNSIDKTSKIAKQGEQAAAAIPLNRSPQTQSLYDRQDNFEAQLKEIEKNAQERDMIFEQRASTTQNRIEQVDSRFRIN